MTARRRSKKRTRTRRRLPWAARAALGVLGAGALVLLGYGAVRFGAGEAGFGAAIAASTTDGGAPDAGLREKVRIVMQTVPPVKAEVRWGKRRLGIIKGPRKPFILERARDSGPLDLVILAEGHLPVHTRAYTFNDGKMFIRLTPVGEKHTLFGYRQELPDAGADGGVPAPGGDAGAPPPGPFGPPAPGPFGPPAPGPAPPPFGPPAPGPTPPAAPAPPAGVGPPLPAPPPAQKL